MEANQHRAETLRALRQLCRGTAPQFTRQVDEQPRLSTGLAALDALLPDRGLEPGWLVEWLVPVDGCGAAVLALQGVRSALERQPIWAVVDDVADPLADRTAGVGSPGMGGFHPSAVEGWGVSLESVLWLRPSSVADAAWTVEQCLRCPAVGITWFQARQIPDRVLQRWKIAAETGGGIGILFRPAKAARYASWSDVRWLLHPQPETSTEGRRVRVELLACRGACQAGTSVELELCDATGHVHLVSAMANTTPAVRARA